MTNAMRLVGACHVVRAEAAQRVDVLENVLLVVIGRRAQVRKPRTNPPYRLLSCCSMWREMYGSRWHSGSRGRFADRRE